MESRQNGNDGRQPEGGAEQPSERGTHHPSSPTNAQRLRPSSLEFPPFTARQSSRAKTAARLLRTGVVVDDDTFDEVFPPAVAHVSALHWTPVEVAVRAARRLAPSRASRVLDIGAGVGKFCLVAAAVAGADVRGVERNRYLASVAREAARRMSLAIDIREGSFETEDPSAYDGLYLFNPFIESLFVPGAIEFGEHDAERAAADVARATEFLRRARHGTRVATFCGFGGKMPDEYERLVSEPCGGGVLEVWTKRNGFT